ncbi:VWA domain-containing protein [Mycobacterium sp. SMC-4]|uniref:vWA domain-containing protein n=1 Tax=Mycobacterium sp. SMC-4 TaxID=2857059 RepID=UPI0021B39285|nr:VWA domain-containing protein [Mycobacterium sp. SMC-4]UXA19081.1 VWA domain-containing protein [Mycobacterium sp. SMC-4]
MKRLRVLALVCCAILLVSCTSDRLTGFSPAPSTIGTPGAPSASSVPTVLILDGSGSMTETDAPGPRIDAAKTAARALVEALPDTSTIALQTYGITTGSAPEDKADGCRDVTLLLSLRPLDREAMNTAIASIAPSGYTPISLALQTAADQLPADDTAQAIVLVSDGEETCDTPPCDTATQLKQARPGLTISTVGFKVDGAAAEQLRCIAELTGGIYVQAANADQLAARLMATQNIDQANTSLSSTGLGGIDLGTPITEIRDRYPDFPAASNSGTTTVTWIDCDFTFIDGTLNAIAPREGGRTIDGVTIGDSVTKATALYGDPLSTTTDNRDTTTVIFDADPTTDNAYQMTIEGFTDTGATLTGTITSIILCRCKPQANTSPTRPAGVSEATVLNMTFPPGTCGSETRGWKHDVPITVRDGRGEAMTASGEFGGASISGAELAGWLDADGDGTEDAVVAFNCFGSTFAMCCAGRSSNLKFVRVFDFSNPNTPGPIGDTITGGESVERGDSHGRRIDQVRIDGGSLITEEQLIYPHAVESVADLGHPPDATIEVTHQFTDGRWVSTERVIR